MTTVKSLQNDISKGANSQWQRYAGVHSFMEHILQELNVINALYAWELVLYKQPDLLLPLKYWVRWQTWWATFLKTNHCSPLKASFQFQCMCVVRKRHSSHCLWGTDLHSFKMLFIRTDLNWRPLFTQSYTPKRKFSVRISYILFQGPPSNN